MSGDVTDVMCLDSLCAPADLRRHSTPDITGKGLRALMTVTRQLAEALCQRKVQYLNEYLKYLYSFVLMELRNYNLRLSLFNPYTSLLSSCSFSSAATALSARTKPVSSLTTASFSLPQPRSSNACVAVPLTRSSLPPRINPTSVSIASLVYERANSATFC